MKKGGGSAVSKRGGKTRLIRRRGFGKKHPYYSFQEEKKGRRADSCLFRCLCGHGSLERGHGRAAVRRMCRGSVPGSLYWRPKPKSVGSVILKVGERGDGNWKKKRATGTFRDNRWRE